MSVIFKHSRLGGVLNPGCTSISHTSNCNVASPSFQPVLCRGDQDLCLGLLLMPECCRLPQIRSVRLAGLIFGNSVVMETAARRQRPPPSEFRNLDSDFRLGLDRFLPPADSISCRSSVSLCCSNPFGTGRMDP